MYDTQNNPFAFEPRGDTSYTIDDDTLKTTYESRIYLFTRTVRFCFFV